VKKSPKKLQLSKETVTTLANELTQVAGGATALCTISCPRTNC
jgi:hypothetical protein